MEHAKIEVVWNSVVVKAYGTDKGILSGIQLKNTKTGEQSDLPVSGLFFAIGHDPATKFLKGQLDVDSEGYIITKPGTT